MKEFIKNWLFKDEVKKHLKYSIEISEYNRLRKADYELKEAYKIIEDYNSRIQFFNAFDDTGNLGKLFKLSTKGLYSGRRRSGSTTRLIDVAIQFLFMFGEIRSDWFIYEGDGKREAREYAFRILRGRLEHEHHWGKIRNIKDVVIIDTSSVIRINKDLF